MNAQQLRNSILQEAIEGRLVPQDPNDEPASVLLERIREEKKRLVKEGKLKKKDLEEIPISEDEKPFDIPNSWEWIRLREITSYRRGSFPQPYTDLTFYGGPNSMPFVQVADVDEVFYRLNNETKKTISQKAMPFSVFVHKGTVVVTLQGSIGKVAITQYDSYVDRTLAIFHRIYGQIDKMFFSMVLKNKFENEALHARGATIKTITKEEFQSFVLPLPPLAEQKRIVAKIEDLLPKVEEYGKAQEALDKLNEELPEKLKKSVLQEAITGKLVPQDPNDEPASVLLNRIREEKKRLVKEGKLKKKDLEETLINEDEIPFDIPDSWEWCKLGTIAALIGGFAFKSHEYASSGSRVIRISDITENGFINKNVVRHLFTDKLSQYVILEGDILMAMTGGTVGKSLYVKYSPEENMLLNQRVALIRVKTVFTDYIDYVIKSQHIQGIITEAKNSTNDNISMGDIYNFPIPLPPLAEQKRIVAKIEELFKEIDKLKASC